MGSRRTRTWPSSSPRRAALLEPVRAARPGRGGSRRGARATRRRGPPAARRPLRPGPRPPPRRPERHRGQNRRGHRGLHQGADAQGRGLAAADGDGAGPIRVTDANVNRALDELLAEGSRLTRILLAGDEAPPPARRGTSWMIRDEG